MSAGKRILWLTAEQTDDQGALRATWGILQKVADTAACGNTVERISVPAASPEVLAAAIAHHVRECGPFSLIVASAEGLGLDVLPRVCGLLRVPMLSQAHDYFPHTATWVRSVYAGQLEEEVPGYAGCYCVSIKPMALGNAPGTIPVPEPAALLPVERATVCLADNRCDALPCTLLETRASTGSTRPALATAHVVVAGGLALGSRENFQWIVQLADALGAAVGASRSAVEAGFAESTWQIGQTGSKIRPEVYLAIGISGAPQHLAGISGAQTIVAVNWDPLAPIRRHADYVITEDLFQWVPRYLAALQGSVAAHVTG